MKLRELFEKINEEIASEQGVIQKEWFDEFLYQFDEFNEFLNENKETIIESVEKSEVDEHRWYGTQFIVFKISNGDDVVYIGVRLVTQSYSEMQSIEDVYWGVNELKFMKPKTITTTIYEEE